MSETQVLNCCLCGDEIDDPFDDHNPYPVATGEDDRCCGRCNREIVIPARSREIEVGQA